MMALSKLAAARLVWRRADTQGPRSAAQASLLMLMAVAILLSGPQIQFLRPSVYQEAILWGGAFSATFVYLALRGITGEKGFTSRLMCAMAWRRGLLF
jgi:hypothetical protein